MRNSRLFGRKNDAKALGDDVSNSLGNIGFAPLNDDHSIERVSFALAFRNPFRPDSVANVEQAHDKWRDALPATSGIINVPNQARNGVVNTPGILFSFLKPNGESTWSMEFSKNEIRVDCYLYSRWEKVWGAAFEYITSALHAASDELRTNELVNVELLVRDVFFANSEQYDLGDFFGNLKYVAPILFKSGPLWHCNTGWFENIADQHKVLHNLNLDARSTSNAERPVVISIEHKLIDLVQTQNSADKKSNNILNYINLMMGDLHKRNKFLLANLLNSNLREKIGLEVESEQI